ncbi:putative disease resistance protein At3g14460 [Ziziphus jujuba]|uniref:Disease resistance protein At3g14460 n=1 Tax=Ziziphus jujuba TaxID=326968 RepID=A0ABM3ZYC7_ZIZJJ|nr:putative disease resistance protein At3g14460 [Ziziphus jujuba]
MYGYVKCALSKLCFDKCKYCKCLPPLGQLPSLKTLYIDELSGVVTVGAEFYGINGSNSARKAFASLEFLRCLPANLEIRNCENLEFPMHHDSVKTSLQMVSISKSCGVSDGLQYQHGLTCLSGLRIRGCLKFISFPNGGLHAPNLTSLIVAGCKKLENLPEQMANLLPSLEGLCIIDCPEVESFPEGGLPSNLRRLEIQNCSKLIAQRAKWNLQKLQALTYFELIGGEGVESFPEEGLLPSTLTHLVMYGFTSLKRLDIKALQQLTSLAGLEIESCPELQNLPQQKLPTSLTALHINKCPILKKRCRRDKGKDWNKISHIPVIYIDNKII